MTFITPHPINFPVPKGQSAKGASAGQHRHEVEKIDPQIARFKDGRPGIEHDLADVRSQFDEIIASSGITVLNIGGRFTVRLPVTAVDAESRGRSIPVAPDPWGVTVALALPDLLAKAEATIRGEYATHDWPTISEEDKRAKLKALAAERLESQRLEAHFAWLARDEGDEVAFRPEMDPRAILAIDGPPPPPKRR